jgi:hypothetical protein
MLVTNMGQYVLRMKKCICYSSPAVEVAVAVAAAWNQELHVGVHSGYGIPGPRPGRQQMGVATDELTAGEMKVDEETHGCLAVAVDVVILCFVV